jgi:hypothetical protein
MKVHKETGWVNTGEAAQGEHKLCPKRACQITDSASVTSLDPGDIESHIKLGSLAKQEVKTEIYYKYIGLIK